MSDTQFKFVGVERTSTLGCWVKEHPRNGNGYRCGNVAVRQRFWAKKWNGDDGLRWFIFLKQRDGTWKRHLPATRPYGYGHQGQAKIGAAMCARWQRERKAT